MRIPNNKNRQLTGIVMFELMLSIILIFIIFGMLIEIYLSLNRSISTQNDIINMQNKASMMIKILSAEIHKAGYIGCAKLTSNFPIATVVPYLITPTNKLMGLSNNQLIIRYADFPCVNLLESSNSYLLTSNNIHYKSDDILIITDCNKAEIIKVKSVISYNNAQKIFLISPLKYVFTKNAEISRLKINKFYLNKTSLYREDIDHRKVELITGIKSMNILYTLKQNNNLSLLKFTEINNWEAISGVLINMEIQTPMFTKTWYLYTALNV